MDQKALWYLPLFCRTLRSAQMPRLSFCDDVFSPGDVAARQWVVVEMGGEPLETFKHPDQAIYILGSEDTGLPDSIVQVPLPRSAPTFLPSPCFAFSETLAVWPFSACARSRRGYGRAGRRRRRITWLCPASAMSRTTSPWRAASSCTTGLQNFAAGSISSASPG